MASSSQLQHDVTDYSSGSNRDTLAETFVTSFFAMQGEVAKAVQKGLSTFFDMDSRLTQCQDVIQEIIAKLSQTTDEASRNEIIKRLDDLLDNMCTQQMSTNQAWNIIDEQITDTVAETESHWKKAEPFFRSKQKRNGDNRNHPQPPENRVKAIRRIQPVVPMKLTPIGGDIVMRPSLLPKKPSLKSAHKAISHLPITTIAITTHSANRKRSSSGSPEPIRAKPEKKMKKNPDGSKKSEKKEKKQAAKEEERKNKLAMKKKRVARPVKRTKREDSEDNNSVSEDTESSDPPYRTLTGAEMKGRGAGKHDPDEPLYCVCRNISYGHMVGCDNESCDFEWFHFVCVGLKAKPRGKWYCPSCRDGENCKTMKNQAGNDDADTIFKSM